jgi:polygalacturonase
VVAEALPASASGAPVTVAVPAWIDAAGRSDVTLELQQFVASVPDGARVVFARGGRYRIDGTLELSSRRDLTLDGNGATLFAGTHGGPNRAELRLIGGSDWTIRDLTIIGADTVPGQFDPQYQWQHGIDLRGVEGALIENVGVRDVFGDDIYVGLSTDSDSRWSRDVSIINSRGVGSGRMAIAITAGRDVLVRGGVWSNPGLSTFDLEPNDASGGAAGVVIQDTTIGTGTRGSVLTVAGGGPVAEVFLQDNRLTGRPLTVLVDQHALRPRDIHVHGNISTVSFAGPGPAAMVFRNTDGVSISANRQPLARGGAVGLLATLDSTHVRVTDQEPYLGLASDASASYTYLILGAAASIYLVAVYKAWRMRR